MERAALPELTDTDADIFDCISSDAAILRVFGERKDSKSHILGVEEAGQRYVIKAASDERGMAWLRSAVQVHRKIKHRAIVPLLNSFEYRSGLALVYPWVNGDVLYDGFDDNVPDREDPVSPYRRFKELPLPELLDALRQVLDAHLAVINAGYVAVDLFEGCLIYDFDSHAVHLIDLDHYQPGPYVLTHGRQLGSRDFMAPEEFRRGATIDERTTVFTLARFALVFLGCARREAPSPDDFRGNRQLWSLLLEATASGPADRVQTVAQFCERWDAAVLATG